MKHVGVLRAGSVGAPGPRPLSDGDAGLLVKLVGHTIRVNGPHPGYIGVALADDAWSLPPKDFAANTSARILVRPFGIGR